MRMRRFTSPHKSLGFALASTGLGVLILTVTAVRAQGPQGGAGAGGATRPLVPMAASTLVLNPDAHYGETVSMIATVEQILSKTTFTVDQDQAKSTGKEILVIVPTLQAPVVLNSYVTIVGDVVRFDPADIARRARDYTLDLPPDAIEKFRGKPAVLATSVINVALTDLAKKPIPPMTPTELALSQIMKQVQPTSGALRTAVDGSNLETTKQNTETLRKGFTEVQSMFKTRGTADAIGWAGEAIKIMDSIDAAAAAGKWDDAKTAAASLTGLCTQCHTAHRERMDDGTYRIKGN
jgi:soluble cytochrome b562